MKVTKFALLSIASYFLLTAFRKISTTNNPCSAASAGISITRVSVVEGNSGQKNAEVMVILSQAAAGPVTVSYITRNGSATAGSDYIAANGLVTFAAGDRMKKIVVPVMGDAVCESNETFDIILRNPGGATLTDSIGKVTIVNDDCIGGNLSVYEVRLTYTGYTSFAGTPADCKIRTNGEVVLTGLISGNEKVSTDDDIVYTGVLQLDINMDICSAKTTEDPQGGYPLCGMTVLGSGPVKTELEIYYDHRGGYIKTENERGDFVKVVFGSCDQAQITEENDMVPNNTIASVFNGRDLAKLTARTLQVGRYAESEDGIETVVEVIRKIR